ncbi:MAG TPA: GNAT family N-acetyltransferase [Devosia sp.]|jgi:GNAT superfamily N-acetyltransferase|uniref:GNAT family N-acetyltransferase n=1 Tax=Devosia sp. TaxID=1871048 RepID=UPI002DDD784A|nr:GNAT family N-acetyltransferase [Devosia sp.]HEV2514513.1 GNAT family N-acetyltransferase [Devosia sp.]
MADKLAFKPVTRATESDFEALFAGPGGPKPCWCMTWRATPQEIKDNKGPARRKQILGRIADGVPVGLLGYADSEPVAWVSVAPRDTFRNLGGPDVERDEKVWSLTCMYLRRQFRGERLGLQLIAAAIAHARRHKADILEAYPVAPSSPSYRFMGFVPAFEGFGFVEVGKAGTRRHVMRLTLS